MAAVASPAASDDTNVVRLPAELIVVDPQLLMAACSGNSERIKELLRLSTEKVGSHGNGGGVVGSGASAGAVVLEVAPDGPPAAPATPPPPPLVDGVTMEGDSLLHVVAACGDDENFIDCATLIISDKKDKGGATAVRRALEARNNKGDTPLHCAARAGNAHMISCLVDLIAANTADEQATESKAAFLRMKNKCGETALHQAVRGPGEAAIDRLLSLDPPELAACSRSNSAPLEGEAEGEGGSSSQLEEADDAGAACCCSPFYLAVSLGRMDAADLLFDKTGPSLRSNLAYYSGPDGRNVLHAAVSRARLVPFSELWKLISEETDGTGRLLLSQLASQGDKENGSTPLHLAASLGGLPSSILLVPPKVISPLDRSIHYDARSGSIVHKRAHCGFFGGYLGSHYSYIVRAMLCLLLDANVAMAYQPDKGGLYPIHVAARSGSLRAVETLLERCPDCATLRDAKGRTLLHVAVEEGRYGVVTYVRRQSQRRSLVARLLSSILNAQDDNGDTPLHRAVHAGNLKTFNSLVRNNRRVHWDVPNKQGMRPIDISWRIMPLKVYYAWDPRIRIRRYLFRVGAPYGENSRGDLFLQQKHILPKQDEDNEMSAKGNKMSADLTASAQVLCIFSVLITTVTFASAFTLPGGYQSAGDGDGGVAGTPVLAGRRSYVFDAFVLSDTLAFMCSLYGTSQLLYAGVPYGTLEGRFRSINLAYSLMWHSGRSLVAAFALGLYVVLLPVDRTMAIAVAVLMPIIAIGFLKASEGIDSMFAIQTPDVALGWTIPWLDHLWSYIIIFGLPAIRKWARLP